MRVISLSGLCPSVGKGEFSAALKIALEARGEKVHQLAFADPVKQMLEVMLRGYGVGGPRLAGYLFGAEKETIIPEVGKSARFLMRTLATEWGRDTVSQDIWVDIARSRITRALADGRYVIVDDLRFRSEYEMLRSLDCRSILVRRPSHEDLSSTHQSDVELRNAVFDNVVFNDGSIDQLQTKAAAIVDELILVELYAQPQLG